VNILTVATAWGSEHGGVNVFNYRLCCALASRNHNVTSYVKSYTPDDLLDAQSKKVVLKSIQRSSSEKWNHDDVGHIKFQDLVDFEVIIIHDIIGAIFLDHLPPPIKERTVVAFVHTLYRDTDYIGDLSDDKRRERTEAQFLLIQKADIVFTSGGWIAEQLLIERPALKGKIHAFVPGRLEMQPSGSVDEGPIMTFGRLSLDNEKKQASGVIAAYKELVSNWSREDVGKHARVQSVELTGTLQILL